MGIWLVCVHWRPDSQVAPGRPCHLHLPSVLLPTHPSIGWHPYGILHGRASAFLWITTKDANLHKNYPRVKNASSMPRSSTILLLHSMVLHELIHHFSSFFNDHKRQGLEMDGLALWSGRTNLQSLPAYRDFRSAEYHVWYPHTQCVVFSCCWGGGAGQYSHCNSKSAIPAKYFLYSSYYICSL